MPRGGCLRRDLALGEAGSELWREICGKGEAPAVEPLRVAGSVYVVALAVEMRETHIGCVFSSWFTPENMVLTDRYTHCDRKCSRFCGVYSAL